MGTRAASRVRPNGKRLTDALLGPPLASGQEGRERIGVGAGVAVLGLDALSSAAYGPEAALTVLRPLGPAGPWLLLPITLAIVVLLTLVAASYRQTLGAYPNGGGAYAVARQNLGPHAGLLAASALLLDYTLNVAVGISAGVGMLVSAVPRLHPYTLELCLGLLALLTLVNLRGVREAGAAFLAPTWLFVLVLVVVILVGAGRVLTSTGPPQPIVAPPPAPVPTQALSLWLVLRAFASGCTALTGVEAISNAVPIFRAPSVRRARTTLGLVVGLLVMLLLGVTLLARAYGVAATLPGASGYQSVLSQLIGAVMGRGVFYAVASAAILAVLSLSANTSFTDFPRVCHLLALDGYLPTGFAHKGRRLGYSRGIVVLALLAGALLVAFRGVTDRLIPLFAIGAFLAFTLSQSGMVRHWRRVSPDGAHRARLLNATGAVGTGLTLIVLLISKFTSGAWISVLLIPLAMGLFLTIETERQRAKRETSLTRPISPSSEPPLIAVVPVGRWSRATERALTFAFRVSQDVHAVHVVTGEDGGAALAADWARYVEGPLAERGHPAPRLELLPSPYRELIRPLREYCLQRVRESPGSVVTVVLPESLDWRWLPRLVQGHRPEVVRTGLLMSGEPRLVVVSVPFFFGPHPPSRA
ncbi:APC family permease [Pyxidicoccus parkwayensis]|uniref:APC family permease n=1 Tax=Pyxidicoccus parkwayensis TaxID=2813578 RepID=A0ABX7P132_9BACT|nr:APC family permease [Pyxidicoccus parkwaysis]QSQ23512.1 APC family permease [Pyxidicoccus parkwaysis]